MNHDSPATQLLESAARGMESAWREIVKRFTPLIDEGSESELDANLIHEARRDAARQAYAQLPPSDQELLSMLFSDPPKPYKVISSTLGIPVGAIGPTRARWLARARSTPAIAALSIA